MGDGEKYSDCYSRGATVGQLIDALSRFPREMPVGVEIESATLIVTDVYTGGNPESNGAFVAIDTNSGDYGQSWRGQWGTQEEANSQVVGGEGQ